MHKSVFNFRVIILIINLSPVYLNLKDIFSKFQRLLKFIMDFIPLTYLLKFGFVIFELKSPTHFLKNSLLPPLLDLVRLWPNASFFAKLFNLFFNLIPSASSMPAASLFSIIVSFSGI